MLARMCLFVILLLNANTAGAGHFNEQKIFFINNLVNNTIQYVPDTVDTWQSPHMTITRGSGDCEDIAIYKAYKLIKEGLPEENLAYTVGIYTYYVNGVLVKQWHMYLRVRYNSRYYYLDNLSSNMTKPPFDSLSSLGVLTHNQVLNDSRFKDK